MPGSRFSEAALERRREKFAFAAAFPGLLQEWEAAEGKTVQAVRHTAEARVVVFTDGTFLVTLPETPSADVLLSAITSARDTLAPFQEPALRELDRRIASEAEAMRLARMEKVLGAVETNLPRIPELRAALRRLLEEDGSPAASPVSPDEQPVDPPLDPPVEE